MIEKELLAFIVLEECSIHEKCNETNQIGTKKQQHSMQTTPALYHTVKKLLEYITRLSLSFTVNGSCVSKQYISPSSMIF